MGLFYRPKNFQRYLILKPTLIIKKLPTKCQKTHTKQYQNHLSDSTHFVMKNLTADTSYLIKLSAQNELGMGKSDLYHSEVRTLKSDPTYVPDLGKKNKHALKIS